MRPVAIKISKGNSSFDRENTRQEAHLLSYLGVRDPKNCRGIIRMLDKFQHKGHDCMVFEWMQGGDLFSYITRNKNQELTPFETVKPVITLAQIRSIALQTTRALAFFEKYGIMHCDLKPENILIEDVKTMKVKLSDMGSSIFMSD